MKPQLIYQELIRQENYAVLAVESLGTLHVRLIVKSKDQTQETYETLIKDLENYQKLSQYFQNFHELLQYMKTSSNIKIHLKQKKIQIIAKGPTKKASQIQLAQIKLKPIEQLNANLNHSFFDHSHLSSEDPEQWMDNLASDIISIIETKSKVHQRYDMMKQYVKKSEFNSVIEDLKKQYKDQIEKNKLTIKQLENICGNILQKSKTQLTNFQQNIKLERNKQISIENKQYEQIIQKFKNEEVFQFQKHLKNIQQSFIQVIEKNHEQFVRLMKEQNQHSKKMLLQEINVKNVEFANKFSTKQQIDAVIKKVQNIGGKLEAFMSQSTKRDKLAEKIYIHERKLNQIQDKFQKQKSKDPSTPKKDHIEFKVLQRKTSALQWVDNQCSHIRRVTFSDNIITLNSLGGAHLFGKIRMKQKSIFHVTIQSMVNRVALGVIDSQYKQKVLYGEQPNKIYYRSDKRCKDGDNKKQQYGLGFRVNQTVTVSVDMKLGMILWKVGNSLRYSWQSDELRNNKIDWVPYVHLYDKGDSISLVQ